MKELPEVILLHERASTSWRRDSASVAAFVALIGIGVFLDSVALQWIGAFIGMLVLVGNITRLVKDNRMTIAQARARLDEIERGEK